MATLTGSTNYFEDFTNGEVYRHARGKTVGEMENHLITHLVMNTAEAHFNADAMVGNMFGQSDNSVSMEIPLTKLELATGRTGFACTLA